MDGGPDHHTAFPRASCGGGAGDCRGRSELPKQTDGHAQIPSRHHLRRAESVWPPSHHFVCFHLLSVGVVRQIFQIGSGTLIPL